MRRRHRLIDQPIQDLGSHPAKQVTVQALAEYLEAERDTIVRMITWGSLHAFKVGREWRIPIEAARAAFPSSPVNRETSIALYSPQRH